MKGIMNGLTFVQDLEGHKGLPTCPNTGQRGGKLMTPRSVSGTRRQVTLVKSHLNSLCLRFLFSGMGLVWRAWLPLWRVGRGLPIHILGFTLMLQTPA